MALNQLSCLNAKWQELLQRRGHYIYGRKDQPDIIRSRNDGRKRYRWLLRVEGSPSWNVSKSGQNFIYSHMEQARKYGEIIYLVVGFTREPKRIVAVPAGAALNAGSICRDKGGIAWND